MTNPDKRWSWGQALGRGTGGAVGTAAAAGAVGALGGPLGIPIGMAVAAAGGFLSGVLGSALGHWWDDPPPRPQSFGSGALYAAVVSGIVALAIGLATRQYDVDFANPARAMSGTAAFCGFWTSLLASYLDDLRAQAARARGSTGGLYSR